MEWVRAVVATTLGVPHDGALPPIMMQQEVPSIWDQIRECYSAGISVYAVPIPVLAVQHQNMCPCPVRSVRKVTIFQTTSPANRSGWSQIGCMSERLSDTTMMHRTDMLRAGAASPLEGFESSAWVRFERALVVRDIFTGGRRTFFSRADAQDFRARIYARNGDPNSNGSSMLL